jgi:flagellar motor protein MotB
VKAAAISQTVLSHLPADLQRLSRIRSGDLYIDVILNFDRNHDELKSAHDAEVVRHIAKSLQQALNASPGEDARIVDIWIEGHTDETMPGVTDARKRFMYNWRLSSSRAASVLYEMDRAGLHPEAGRRPIHAIGYADTRPLVPNPKTESDRLKNRRTTFRLHPDRCLIDARINNHDAGYCRESTGEPQSPQG